MTSPGLGDRKVLCRSGRMDSEIGAMHDLLEFVYEEAYRLLGDVAVGEPIAIRDGVRRQKPSSPPRLRAAVVDDEFEEFHEPASMGSTSYGGSANLTPPYAPEFQPRVRLADVLGQRGMFPAREAYAPAARDWYAAARAQIRHDPWGILRTTASS
ncbi:hypothetical protein BU26DRAFT_590998 [Trematosphaeria pertusa]|uniref:Uncharacterized protein n=1 Tax=Trematosphaeria pertusa TaxID=390896 RepID=A0A6A6IQQ8_9PLEO|nr:uncharacterized protein BU26DRAFT_590998 [Trematosphaeria pertusa]KAF2252547.1 hypothetical protein BU26DRAFT_590998 [Trematosphaeria pertusa]